MCIFTNTIAYVYVHQMQEVGFILTWKKLRNTWKTNKEPYSPYRWNLLIIQYTPIRSFDYLLGVCGTVVVIPNTALSHCEHMWMQTYNFMKFCKNFVFGKFSFLNKYQQQQPITVANSVLVLNNPVLVRKYNIGWCTHCWAGVLAHT